MRGLNWTPRARIAEFGGSPGLQAFHRGERPQFNWAVPESAEVGEDSRVPLPPPATVLALGLKGAALLLAGPLAVADGCGDLRVLVPLAAAEAEVVPPTPRPAAVALPTAAAGWAWVEAKIASRDVGYGLALLRLPSPPAPVAILALSDKAPQDVLLAQRGWFAAALPGGGSAAAEAHLTAGGMLAGKVEAIAYAYGIDQASYATREIPSFDGAALLGDSGVEGLVLATRTGAPLVAPAAALRALAETAGVEPASAWVVEGTRMRRHPAAVADEAERNGAILALLCVTPQTAPAPVPQPGN